MDYKGVPLNEYKRTRTLNSVMTPDKKGMTVNEAVEDLRRFKEKNKKIRVNVPTHTDKDFFPLKKSSDTVMDDEIETEIVEKKEDPMVEFPELPTEGDKPFKMNNQRIMLTYKSHLPKEKFIENFSEKIHFQPTFIRLAHETADAGHPYLHTHVVIDFGKRFQTTNARFFDIKVDELGIIHPNIKKILSVQHFDNSKNYLAKEDEENIDLKKKPSIYTMVSNCKSKEEVLQMVKKPTDVQGMLTLWDNKQGKVVKNKIHKITRWQKQCYSRINFKENSQSSSAEDFAGIEKDYTPEEIEKLCNQPHVFKSRRDRKIMCWVQEGGCMGKTWYGRQLMIHDPKKYFMMQGVANLRDAATIIEGALKNGWQGDCLIINIPKSCADHQIYTTIEAMRDGVMTSQKYSGKTFMFDIKDMIVISNFILNPEKVSADRWMVFEIDKNGFAGKSAYGEPIDFERVKEIYKEQVKKRADLEREKRELTNPYPEY